MSTVVNQQRQYTKSRGRDDTVFSVVYKKLLKRFKLSI